MCSSLWRRLGIQLSEHNILGARPGSPKAPQRPRTQRFAPVDWVLPDKTKEKEEQKPPVFQGGMDESKLFPPPYSPLMGNAPPPLEEEGQWEELPQGLTQSTQSHRGAPPQPDTTVTLPLRLSGLADADGNQLLWYWPFTTIDLYNWRIQNAPFSKNPQELINLLETVLFNHQPTWDDCNQLLSILFTTEERNQTLEAARKAVPGPTRAPLKDPAIINAYFPATRPDWDYNMAQGP